MARSREGKMIVGAEIRSDGSIDYSRAATMLENRSDAEEAHEVHPLEAQLAKALKEAGQTIVDPEAFMGRFETLPDGVRADLEMDAVYSAKFEKQAEEARGAMQALERQLNTETDAKEKILKMIVEARDDAMNSEAEAMARRAEMRKKFEGIAA